MSRKKSILSWESLPPYPQMQRNRSLFIVRVKEMHNIQSHTRSGSSVFQLKATAHLWSVVFCTCSSEGVVAWNSCFSKERVQCQHMRPPKILCDNKQCLNLAAGYTMPIWTWKPGFLSQVTIINFTQTIRMSESYVSVIIHPCLRYSVESTGLFCF